MSKSLILRKARYGAASVVGLLASLVAVFGLAAFGVASAAPSPKPSSHSQVAHFSPYWTPARLAALRAEIKDHSLNR